MKALCRLRFRDGHHAALPSPRSVLCGKHFHTSSLAIDAAFGVWALRRYRR
ncbi:hypothetical protein ACQ856_23215 [Mycolicibacterium psychrotolerans]|uniref:hypothetical protein n=1 Tax=Mycolicibacterium psychrotolerans TaxID=216929 RepID=UPI003D66DC00